MLIDGGRSESKNNDEIFDADTQPEPASLGYSDVDSNKRDSK